jgi:hypothetical protein
MLFHDLRNGVAVSQISKRVKQKSAGVVGTLPSTLHAIIKVAKIKTNQSG